MNIQRTDQDYPLYATVEYTLAQRQARRRQRLGIMLIVVGSLWLCLRLTGWVGDLPLPIYYWMEEAMSMLKRFSVNSLALSVPEAAYGMLAIHTIHARYSN